jgi:hypothetical protein
MRTKPLARATGSLVGLAAVAVLLFLGLLTALTEVGIPQWVASATAVGTVVTVSLAVADAFTPLGTDNDGQLRAKQWSTLATDFLVAGVVSFVVGFVGARLLLSPDAGGLRRLVVVSLALVLGYGTFVGRNLEIYGIEPAEDDGDGRQP